MSDYSSEIRETGEELSKNEISINLKFGIHNLNPCFLFLDDENDKNIDIKKNCDENIKIKDKLFFLDEIINDKEKFNYKDLNGIECFDTESEITKNDEAQEINFIKRNSLLNGILTNFSSKTSLQSTKEIYDIKFHKINKDYSKSLDSNNCLNTIGDEINLDKTINSIKKENIDILKLVNVSHLLEYQSNSNSTLLPSLNNSSKITYFKADSLDNRTNYDSNGLLRGGNIDALIILATSSSCFIAPHHRLTKMKNSNNNQSLINNNITADIKSNTNIRNVNNRSNFMFQEAFLTTYRAFIKPLDLINKLIFRYRLFSNQNMVKMKKISYYIDSSNELKAKNYKFENNERFDLNRSKLIFKSNRTTKLIAINCLTFLVRVVDEIRYFISILISNPLKLKF
jgi:hypothetical protein